MIRGNQKSSFACRADIGKHAWPWRTHIITTAGRRTKMATPEEMGNKASQGTCCSTKSHVLISKGPEKVNEDTNEHAAVDEEVYALLRGIKLKKQGHELHSFSKTRQPGLEAAERSLFQIQTQNKQPLSKRKSSTYINYEFKKPSKSSFYQKL